MSAVGVMCVVLLFSSSDEVCSRRSSRAGPVRVRRVCIASGVSLPLESVLEVSASLCPESSCLSGGCWLSVIKVSRMVLVGWSVRCFIMWRLHVSNACSPCTVCPVSGSIMASFVDVRLRGKGKAFVCTLLIR